MKSIVDTPEFQEFIASKLSSEFASYWLKKNRSMVDKWFDPDAIKTTEPSTKAQQFHSSRRVNSESVRVDPFTQEGLRIKTKQVEKDMVGTVIEEISDSLVAAAVFGATGEYISGDYRHCYIGGFFEQTGRLPTASDKVVIHGMIYPATFDLCPDGFFVASRSAWVDRVEILP